MKKFLFNLLCVQILVYTFARSIGELNSGLLEEGDENLEVNPEELGGVGFIEGDIVFKGGRSGLSAKTARWPNGTIPYEIDGDFDAFEMDAIERAFEVYHNNTCIRWVPRTNQKDFVRISDDSSGCFSNLGRVGGPQDINLESACFRKFGTVVHELMHSVGFIHEQSRPDRDEFVTIQIQNVKYGHTHNFKRQQKGDINDFGVGYDYESVMHYPSSAFSKNGKPTIIPKVKGVEIGQRKGFSKKDIEKINKMYECAK